MASLWLRGSAVQKNLYIKIKFHKLQLPCRNYCQGPWRCLQSPTKIVTRNTIWQKINNILNNHSKHKIISDVVKLGKRHDKGPLQWICFGSGLGSLLFCYRNSLIANCERQHKTSRIDHLHDDPHTKAADDATFNWREFFELLKSDFIYLILAIVCAFGSAIVTTKIPLCLGDIVNTLTEFTKGATKDFLESVKGSACKLCGLYVIQGLLTFCYISLMSTVGENLANRLRCKLFHSLLVQDIAFFDAHKTGELVDRLTSDVQDFKSSFKLCISQGLKASTQTIGCVGTLFMISPKLTGIMITVIPGIVCIGALLGSGLRKLSKSAQAQVAKATGVADEALGNVRTVKAFAMEDQEFKLFEQEVQKSRNLNVKLGLGIGMFQGLANIALNGIVLGTMMAGGLLLSNHSITAGDLMSFLVASQIIERSLAQMSLLFGNVVKGLSAGARVFQFINSEPSIPSKGGKKIPYYSMEGNVEFKDVHFAYPTRPEQEVLKGFDLKIPKRNVVALVGLSGGGKSTVASLLERFYDIQQGEITIDGYDLKDLDPSWLRGKAIGFINQEPVLFATTVLENIRYGKPHATDVEVMEAAQKAHAHEFITKFPNGYNTILGERGVTVSGGQKQRIAIARALIKDPSILVLDEATSALDAESERYVQEALNDVMKGRTVLVIAHRLSTIRDADIIAVVSNGMIVEIGNHETLKKKKGLYWELIRQQDLEEAIQEHAHGNFFHH